MRGGGGKKKTSGKAPRSKATNQKDVEDEDHEDDKSEDDLAADTQLKVEVGSLLSLSALGLGMKPANTPKDASLEEKEDCSCQQETICLRGESLFSLHHSQKGQKCVFLIDRISSLGQRPRKIHFKRAPKHLTISYYDPKRYSLTLEMNRSL